jgi:hypothetical protein
MGTHTTPETHPPLLFCLSFRNHSTAAFVSLFSQKLMTSQVSNSVSHLFSLLFSLSLVQIILFQLLVSDFELFEYYENTQQIKQPSNAFSF